jgi:outer membrane protein OmpA-like peptidoglycan-associated protein
MNTKHGIKVSMGLALALGGVACATATAPRELVTARTSYQRVRQGPAATFDPADLSTAQKAMEAAEQSYAKDGDTQKTRDLAYTADRRSLIAEARANATQSWQQQQSTVDAMHSETSAQLGQANKQLAAQGNAIQNKDQQLATERQARADADKRAAQAAADLAKFASVKQEARGMVITLSGSVLFASGKADLLPGAQTSLDGVASALTQQDPDSKIVVEGHTDSQGGASYNEDLSQRRAQNVRMYLTSRGIGADRLSSQGYGSSRPIADNASAEGRANNRRVEIVVQPSKQAGTRTM